MPYQMLSLLLLPGLLIVCVGMAEPTPPADRLKEFRERAAAFNAVITLPQFETTPDQIRLNLRETIARGNAALDQLGRLKPGEVTFENTVRALDDIGYEINLTGDRFGLIKETSTNAALREAATDALKELQEWAVGLDYREDVYQAIKAYAHRQPKLEGEAAKLLFETMRDYRRAGLDLPKPQRDEVERLRKELTRLMTDYESNITRAQKDVKFTRAELEGVPESFLAQAKTGADEYTVKANVTWHLLSVMDNARREETRKRLQFERDNLARESNLPLLEKILPLRDNIARQLGYPSWADYRIEVKMATNAATAMDFLEKLKAGLQPKFDAELAEFRRLKIKETGDPNARVNLWDWRYLSNQLKKEKYNVDAEQLRVYFPYQRVLDGMFRIYQSIFGLRFEPVEPPQKWIGDLQLYAVADAQSGEPLGLFYLDMFPREGKYHHFAQFHLVGGKRLASGKYQRPTVALICNFPSPAPDKPSLLSHSDVETIFHEFGHAMHSILTRAQYSRFAGTSVPGDFVEAPSQMLENWVWDKKVLDSFAADYRDPEKKIPADILAKLREAKLATEATRYRRQLSFGLTDLTLHTQIRAGNAAQTLTLANQVLSDVFLPMMPDTAFVAYFGHLMGYDAGYYGYAWADAIAADMATVFEHAPKGYFDTTAGRRLRTEIYEPGNSRDVNVSIEKFLGRKPSLAPFLRKLGIESK
ncbi:MAG TPA: M3 family metallopeptidase [Verrucomicrobiota bacterium]|jgi:thimet oligopeptidase|nr:Zn-dependent oligopeptidase [Verrucomicrobiota bacterium]OQC23151.1 MAG: Oligopeptidase A [Verrucomicrobia bacterium ADurb.Bin063]HRR64569.1 M3 family metallopeptidase [Candidatus Paceibacterota bacterium]MBP8015353.1 Zn-dependent oligopeptidase [Verrucomicrobiota bacterium]MDI9372829.1 M3 family metallopeptidase [Verrucomicrobiota bacterium]